MEYYNNILCISTPELTQPDDDAIISHTALRKYVERNPNVRVRWPSPAGPALYSWNSLRDDLKQAYVERYGDPVKQVRHNALEELLVPDARAAQYYSSYQIDDGRNLPFKVQQEYTINACVLNAVNKLVNNRKAKSRALGNRAKQVWELVSNAVNDLQEPWVHSLPANPVRLKDKLKQYLEGGYPVLIHRGYGNGNSRKVNDRIERLIMSIYSMQNLPFMDWVHDYYLRFLGGELQIVDGETGELYDREDFYDDKKQTYITISKATVYNVLNNPMNAVIIDRMRSSRIDHDTKATPYNRRHAPVYSLSKISADDRTLPRKTLDGKWVNAYYAFDVASGVVLSAVYDDRKPDTEMVWECFRELYRNVEQNNLMWPIELEVENHLMKPLEEQLRQMFSFVTYTNPGTSKSKRAEHYIHAKKYQDERRHQIGIGRWHSKSKHYSIKTSTKDPDYKEPRLPREQIIAEDMESVMRFNNELHPNQKLYPGMTRWQVLVENMNPDAGRPEKYKLFRFMGLQTETSIRNNDAVQVQYQHYGIEKFEVLRMLKANNYKVTACYVPASDGSINEVYLYQADRFISKATLIERYNEAKAERTERDEEIRTAQAKRKANFYRIEKEGLAAKIDRKLVIEEQDNYQHEQPVKIVDMPRQQEESLDELMQRYSGKYYQEKSINDL
jgi:hypothetical protein